MNIFGYLKWRADVPLQAAPFNDADNLILAELSYSDFGGIVPEDGREIAIEEVCERFFRSRSREELLASKSYTAKAPLLMEEMCGKARFGGTRLAFYRSENDPETELQFGAVTFLLPDGTAYAAFRGTDGTLVGWKEDFRLSYLCGTESQKRAAAYLTRVAAETGRPMRAGGHSKGGNLAMYAAACCSPEAQAQLTDIYNNDGPGFHPEFLEQDGYLRILPRITFLVPDTSVIGMMLDTGKAPRVVRSTTSGIVQHDAFTWETSPDGLEAAELSDTSRLVRQMLEGWLDMTDDEARKAVTDTVFSLLESTGEEKFSGISESRWKSMTAMASSARKLPKGALQGLAKLVALMGQSGVRAASSYISGKTSEKVHSLVRHPKKKAGDEEYNGENKEENKEENNEENKEEKPE